MAMTNRERILSHLRNRGAKLSTNETVAIATRVKIQSVSPIIARLIHDGVVAVSSTSMVRARSGGWMRTFALAAFVPPEDRPPVKVRHGSKRQRTRVEQLRNIRGWIEAGWEPGADAQNAEAKDAVLHDLDTLIEEMA